MSWLDKIPTAVEILSWLSCRLTDHDFTQDENGKWRCTDCGKVKP